MFTSRDKNWQKESVITTIRSNALLRHTHWERIIERTENPTNLKAQGLRGMAVRIKTLKGERHTEARTEPEGKLRERPEASYVFFLFFNQNFSGFLLGEQIYEVGHEPN